MELVDETIVTVLFFAYNHENFIAKGIESVLSQKTDYKYKIYVYDDCSTDNTSKVVDMYVQAHPGMVYLKRSDENHGLNWQFEHAVLEVDTKYFTLTGGDDYWIDDKKLDKQISYLEDHSDTSMVITGKRCVDESTGNTICDTNYWKWDMPLDRGERLCSFFLNKMEGGYPAMTTSCIRTDIVKKCIKEKNYIIKHSTPGEGTTILTAISLYGGKIHFLKDITVAYLVRSNSLSHHTDTHKQLAYFYGYTELRVLIMCDVVSRRLRVLKYAALLFINDIKYSCRHKIGGELVELVRHSRIVGTYKVLFVFLFLAYCIKEKASHVKMLLLK